MKNGFLFLSVLILISSCSSRYTLQKRRYTKGFYFSNMSLKKDLKGNTRYSIKESKSKETTKFTEPILCFEPIQNSNEDEKQNIIDSIFSSPLYETIILSISNQTKVSLNNNYNSNKIGFLVQEKVIKKSFRSRLSPSLVPMLLISGLILFILLIASLRKDDNDSLKKLLAMLFVVSGAVLFLIGTLGGSLSVFFLILSLSLMFLGLIIASRIGFLDF